MKVRLEMRGNVAHVVLDAPPRNEMDTSFFADLAHVTRREIPERTPEAVVVHGSGRHFSSGADVPELDRRIRDGLDGGSHEFLLSNADAVHALEDVDAFTVAAIRGVCMGSGLEIALACDARIAEPNALLALPEVEHGLVPGCGATARLPWLVGTSRALEMILTGRPLMGDEAHECGLVDAVVPRSRLLVAAERLALAGAERI